MLDLILLGLTVLSIIIALLAIFIIRLFFMKITYRKFFPSKEEMIISYINKERKEKDIV